MFLETIACFVLVLPAAFQSRYSMSFKIPFIPLLFLMVAQSVCSSAPKVAVLHPEEYSSYWLETKDLENVVEVDHFTINNLEALSAKLRQYALVILGTQANYDAKRNFGEYHQAWDGFVRGGGILLMLDGRLKIEN